MTKESGVARGDEDGGHGGDVNGVRSVARALDILSLLTEDRASMSLRDIVTETGLAKTTVIRLTQTLEQLGLLWAVPQGFMAGPALWRWAHLTARAWELQPDTKDAMRELAERHRETVNLYVRRDVHRVCIAQQESTQSLRHVVRVGDELAMWAGASSRILLSGASDQLLERVADTAPDGRKVLPDIRKAIDEAAANGFAVSRGEREAGITAVAVPVRGKSGDVVAALSLSGPSIRFTEDRIATFITDLQRCSAVMSRHGFDHPLANRV